MDTNFNLDKILWEAGRMPAPEPEILIPESDARDMFQERYDYLSGVFEEEFEETWYRFYSACILHYEIINLLGICKHIMEKFGFPEKGESRFLRYAVAGVIFDYLND